MNTPQPLPLSYYFLAGGIGDVTACLVSHPFDTIKVRQQISGELSATKQQQGIRALLNTSSSILSKEGLVGVYRGISASILRQSTFSTLRHGGYATVCTILVGNELNWTSSTTSNQDLPPHPSKNVPILHAILAGAFVGSLAASISNPSDVALIRMQSDGHWPSHQRRRYKHVFHAIRTIVQTEGLHRLWRGCFPTVVRASLVTTTQLPTYHLTKKMLLDYMPKDVFPLQNNDTKLHVLASINSAFVASVVTCPVDVVKTRIINMQSQRTQTKNGAKKSGVMYKNAMDCVKQTVKIEGVRGMFKGLIPTFFRLGPHTVVLWNVQELVLRKLCER